MLESLGGVFGGIFGKSLPTTKAFGGPQLAFAGGGDAGTVVVNIDARGAGADAAPIIRAAAEQGAKQGFEMVKSSLRRGGSMARLTGRR